MDPQRGEAYFNLGVLYKDFRAAKQADIKASQASYRTARQYFQEFLSKGGSASDKADAKDNIDGLRQGHEAARRVHEEHVNQSAAAQRRRGGTAAGGGAGSGGAAGGWQVAGIRTGKGSWRPSAGRVTLAAAMQIYWPETFLEPMPRAVVGTSVMSAAVAAPER